MISMIDIILICIIAIVVIAALAFIIKEKKSGRRCIGCPSSQTCSKKCCSNK